MRQTNKKFISEKAAAMAAGATINILYNIGIYGSIYNDKVMRVFTIFFKYKEGKNLPHLPQIDCTEIRRWKDLTEDTLGVSFDFEY